MRPVDVTPDKVEQIGKRVFVPRLTSLKDSGRLKKGVAVRINSTKSVFDKGYVPSWSEEVFKLDGARAHPRKVFKVVDINDEPVRGTFYPEELQEVDYKQPDKFIVEKILRKRKLKGKPEVLVKWKDLPVRLSTWIPEGDLQNYESV